MARFFLFPHRNRILTSANKVKAVTLLVPGGDMEPSVSHLQRFGESLTVARKDGFTLFQGVNLVVLDSNYVSLVLPLVTLFG